MPEMLNPPVRTEHGLTHTINPAWTKAFIARLRERIESARSK